MTHTQKDAGNSFVDEAPTEVSTAAEGRHHPILACFADIYALSLLAGGAVALVLSLLQRAGTAIISVALLLAVLCFAVVYHSVLAARVKWRTPGELMMGKVVEGGVKVWRNPYHANRALLFVLFFVSLVIAGNSWDGLGTGFQFEFSATALQFFFVGVLLAGLSLFGLGKPIGGLGLVAYFCWLLLRTLLAEVPDSVDQQIWQDMRPALAVGIASILVLAAAICFYYARKVVHS